MAYELVQSGGVADLPRLAVYEGELEEGAKGLLELDLRMPVSQNIANDLEGKLRAAGIPGVRVTTASPLIRIYFNKGFPWLAVIAAAILGLIVLAILIVGWRLYKEVLPGGKGLFLAGGLGMAVLAVLAIGVIGGEVMRAKRR